MVQIMFTEETSLSPEQVLSAATDFTEGRPRIWSNIDPKVYRVHSVDEASADVTEGTQVLGGIWARESYDWSTPGTLRAVVQESNVYRPGSSWEIRVDPRPGGGSTVRWEVRRLGLGMKGRLLELMLRLQGRKFMSGYLREVLANLERAA